MSGDFSVMTMTSVCRCRREEVLLSAAGFVRFLASSSTLKWRYRHSPPSKGRQTAATLPEGCLEKQKQCVGDRCKREVYLYFPRFPSIRGEAVTSEISATCIIEKTYPASKTSVSAISSIGEFSVRNGVKVVEAGGVDDVWEMRKEKLVTVTIPAFLLYVLAFSAGLRISELLELKPGVINEFAL